jgi:hypothetical protein
MTTIVGLKSARLLEFIDQHLCRDKVCPIRRSPIIGRTPIPRTGLIQHGPNTTTPDFFNNIAPFPSLVRRAKGN